MTSRNPSPFKKASLRRRLRTSVAWNFRRATSGIRALPAWVIIGAPRAGTSSLYEWLSSHPQVIPAFRKETHFLDDNHQRGPNYYRANFPLQSELSRDIDGSMTTGEATPNYLVHPLVPRRFAQLIPNAKVIVMLRDPVDRAHSAWRLKRMWGGEEESSFAKAIELEATRVQRDLDRLAAGEVFKPLALNRWGYKTKGLYAEQLERWFEFVPRENFLVIRSEDMYEHPGPTFTGVCEFIGIAPRDLSTYPVMNKATAGAIDVELRRELRTFFEEPNARLSDLLGRDFGWDG